MKISQEIAELAGAFAADGSMQKEHLCMWGNIHQDAEYYDIVLSRLFLEAFDIRIRPHPKPSNSVYGFYVCKKEVIKFFNEVLGFPIGSKTYTVEVPKIIMDDPSLYAAFIRGFTDNDGCLYFSKRKGKYCKFKLENNTYPRIDITSVSHKIIDEIKYMLDHLEIKGTVVMKKNGKKQKVQSKAVYIRGEENLRRWMKIIGFNNSVYFTKIQVWQKFGFCPTHKTLEERKAMLAQ